MSNYNSLKTTIDANIKQNGRQEITGPILNSVLNQMVTTLGAGYQFAGVATTATNPGSPDAKVFYIANGKGKYEKFGGLEVTEDEVVVLYWDSAWHKVATGVASQEKLSELESKTDSINGAYAKIEPMYPTAPDYPEAKINIKANTKVVLIESISSYIAIFDSEKRNKRIDLEKGIETIVPFDATYASLMEDKPSDIKIRIIGIIEDVIEQNDKLRDDVMNGFANTNDEIGKIKSNMVTSINKDLKNNELFTSKVIKAINGSLIDIGIETYEVLKYDISQYIGKTIKVSAISNYANAFYAINDSNDNLLLSEASPNDSNWATIFEKEIIVPNNASHIYVADKKNDKIAKVSVTTDKYINLKKWEGLKWGLIGDSLTDSVNRSRTSKFYFEYISELTGIEFVNLAKSGSSYGRPQESGNAFFQQASRLPTDVDVVTIFGSFNGWGIDVEGTIDDTEPTTRYGCINKCINTIHEINPVAQIGIVAPTPWSTDGYNPFVNDSEGNNWGERYINMLQEVCKKRGLLFLDLYHESELRPWDVNYRRIVYDKDTAGLDGNPSGVHPNEIGHKLIASHFQALLEKLLIQTFVG